MDYASDAEDWVLDEVNMLKGRPKKDAASMGGVQPAKASKANGNGANLGFEAQLFLAAVHFVKNHPAKFGWPRFNRSSTRR
jgi:hypothetical protein